MATRVPSIYSNNFGCQIFGILHVIREIHPAFKIVFGFDLTENSTELSGAVSTKKNRLKKGLKSSPRGNKTAQNPYMGKKQTGVPKAGKIRTRTYREALKSKVGANALELRFNFAPSHCQRGGAPFFEGPWELNRG